MPRRITWASARSAARFSRPRRGGFGIPIVYVNQVGGNDQLVFDGSSFAMDAKGDVIACGGFV